MESIRSNPDLFFLRCTHLCVTAASSATFSFVPCESRLRLFVPNFFEYVYQMSRGMSFLIYPNKLRRLSGAIMRALSGGGVGVETRHALSATFSSRRSSASVAGPTRSSELKSSDAIKKHAVAQCFCILLEENVGVNVTRPLHSLLRT